jgi:hypothetical protein
MADEENNMPDETMDSKGSKEKKEHKHASKHHKPAKHDSTPKTSNSFNGWMIFSMVLFLVAILFMVLWLTKSGGVKGEVSSDEAKVIAADFINNYLVQAGTSATVESVVETNGMYKLTVDYKGSKITSYLTKDGKVLIPQGTQAAIAIDEFKATATQPAAQPTTVPKTDKPAVEVFVMSYCPFGTQIEKGLLPVVGLLGSQADIKIKFVDYVMHGQKESDENLLQYCIQQEYPTQYYKYLQCFLNASDSPGCRASLGFDQAKLDACTKAADAQFGISKDYADKSTWRGSYPRFAINSAEVQKYGVQGSPTLVINGVQASSARDPNSLKNIICDAFTTKPAACNTALPTASPSAGFGFGTSASDAAAATCG